VGAAPVATLSHHHALPSVLHEWFAEPESWQRSVLPFSDKRR